MQLTEEQKSIIKESLNVKGKRRKDEVKLDNNSNYLLDEIPERMYNEMINDMETKEFKIQVPEGYEIDKENSTFECIKFKPIKKNMTYEDVSKELFENKWSYYVMGNGCIGNCFLRTSFINNNNCTSREQTEKLLAINKLLNVAKYLNCEWKPNWNDTSRKYYIVYPNINDKFYVDFSLYVHSSFVYFKSEELARQAIEILGEETIKTALSTDW